MFESASAAADREEGSRVSADSLVAVTVGAAREGAGSDTCILSLVKTIILNLIKTFSIFDETIELNPFGYTHRVISDKIHRLLVTLAYFRPDRFVQLLSLIPILILILYLLVSIDLVYTGLCELVPK